MVLTPKSHLCCIFISPLVVLRKVLEPFKAIAPNSDAVKTASEATL
jgi:hypothetical protein